MFAKFRKKANSALDELLAAKMSRGINGLTEHKVTMSRSRCKHCRYKHRSTFSRRSTEVPSTSCSSLRVFHPKFTYASTPRNCVQVWLVVQVTHLGRLDIHPHEFNTALLPAMLCRYKFKPQPAIELLERKLVMGPAAQVLKLI